MVVLDDLFEQRTALDQAIEKDILRNPDKRKNPSVVCTAMQLYGYENPTPEKD